MAKHKHKKRAFGSPPAWHRKESARLLKAMRSERAEFLRRLQRGDCVGALNTLIAVEAIGSAAYRERFATQHGERLAAGASALGPIRGSTVLTRRAMRRRFLKICRVTKKGRK